MNMSVCRIRISLSFQNRSHNDYPIIVTLHCWIDIIWLLSRDSPPNATKTEQNLWRKKGKPPFQTARLLSLSFSVPVFCSPQIVLKMEIVAMRYACVRAAGEGLSPGFPCPCVSVVDGKILLSSQRPESQHSLTAHL